MSLGSPLSEKRPINIRRVSLIPKVTINGQVLYFDKGPGSGFGPPYVGLNDDYLLWVGRILFHAYNGQRQSQFLL